MTHFGVICPVSSGHLNTMLPLTRELQKRGHRLTFIGIPDAEAKISAAGLEFCAIATEKYSAESREEALKKLAKMKGLAALKYTVELLANGERNLFEYTPEVIKKAGIEALLVDQVFKAGGTIAEYLDIPFITICSAVVLNREPLVPPHCNFWHYSPSWWARLRNQIGYQILNLVTKPMREVVFEYRQKWQLPLKYDTLAQELAQISHQPAELEFPRENLPKNFHFTGPYHYTSIRSPIDFPWEKLNGKPLIYASMGTVQNLLRDVFQKIAAACQDLEAQLVISLGGSAKPESLPKLAGNPIDISKNPEHSYSKKLNHFLLLVKNQTLKRVNQGLKRQNPFSGKNYGSLQSRLLAEI